MNDWTGMKSDVKDLSRRMDYLSKVLRVGSSRLWFCLPCHVTVWWKRIWQFRRVKRIKRSTETSPFAGTFHILHVGPWAIMWSRP